jgi:hypothetical protein
MPILLKSHFYRNVKNKAGVDVIPLENIEVDRVTFCQYKDVTTEFSKAGKNEKNIDPAHLRDCSGGGTVRWNSEP